MCKRFCNIFSGSSPWAAWQLQSAHLHVELSENMLQILFHCLPPQTVQLSQKSKHCMPLRPMTPQNLSLFQETPANYQFSWGVLDGYTGNDFGQDEARFVKPICKSIGIRGGDLFSSNFCHLPNCARRHSCTGIFSLKHESSIFRSFIQPCMWFLHDGTG